ncbi:MULTISPECIES: HlyD family efflux transporter periplasmic adaptor subunit [Oscillatoriales]|uniref:HlyD family efflux transporter periplasmic adaptor subunit n=1 Tax=Oscillatoriales TaxID=1150 RepID=UPI0001C3825E|nr:hemolysin D [Arthrospira platensis str. Paraca]MDT9310375.1 HlyD family efflux transporter periplasmic adaptor subunit [Limnospira sp. Paracas R14]
MLQSHSTSDFTSTGFLGRRISTWAMVATVGLGSVASYMFWQSTQESQEMPLAVASLPVSIKVTALGRLEPEGEVISISAAGGMENNLIQQLLVQEGDWVQEGDAIAILDSRDRLLAAIEKAQEQVGLATAKLEQIKAGAKIGELEAARATIARLETERLTNIEAGQAMIARLEAERSTDIVATEAKIARLQAQKQGEWQVARATINRIEAEYNNAVNDERRYQELHQQGAISEELWNLKRLHRITTEEQLQEARFNLIRIENTYNPQIQETQAQLTQIRLAKQQQIEEAQANLDGIDRGGTQQIREAMATLNRIAEVRPVDIAVAEAEVRSAQAALRQAQADLALAEIIAPRNGQVLKIHAHPGEKIDNLGILELGETRQMVAIAEVYESDIHRVKIGQSARITSAALEGELSGIVDRVGLQIQRQDVINADPSANIDSRVVEVRVRLDETASQKVAGLTNLQVLVVMKP